MIDQLQQDCKWIRGERDVLRQQVNKLQATNEELGRNLQQANLAINLCLARFAAPPGTNTDMDDSMLALVTSVEKRPLNSLRQSGHAPLPAPLNPLPSMLDTPTSQITPPLSARVGRLPLESPSEGTPTLLRPTPQPLASLAAPPRQSEEEDTEPQEGPESQH